MSSGGSHLTRNPQDAAGRPPVAPPRPQPPQQQQTPARPTTTGSTGSNAGTPAGLTPTPARPTSTGGDTGGAQPRTAHHSNGAPPSKPPIIEVTQNAVYFPLPITGDIINTIGISNKENQAILYKIRTSTPTRFTVKPRVGLLKANETLYVNFKILRHGAELPTEQTRDRFVINSRFPTSQEEIENPADAWSSTRVNDGKLVVTPAKSGNEVDPHAVGKITLPCVYGQPPDSLQVDSVEHKSGKRKTTQQPSVKQHQDDAAPSSDEHLPSAQHSPRPSDASSPVLERAKSTQPPSKVTSPLKALGSTATTTAAAVSSNVPSPMQRQSTSAPPPSSQQPTTTTTDTSTSSSKPRTMAEIAAATKKPAASATASAEKKKGKIRRFLSAKTPLWSVVLLLIIYFAMSDEAVLEHRRAVRGQVVKVRSVFTADGAVGSFLPGFIVGSGKQQGPGAADGDSEIINGKGEEETGIPDERKESQEVEQGVAAGTEKQQDQAKPKEEEIETKKKKKQKEADCKERSVPPVNLDSPAPEECE